MKNTWRLALVILTTNMAFAQARSPSASGPVAHLGQGTVVNGESSAQRAVFHAQEMVAGNPKDAGAYTALGLALCHRAQETADTTVYWRRR